MPLRSVEAATRDDAIAAAREQFGPSARVVGVRRVRSGGVLGFFATERYVAEVAADPFARPDLTAPGSDAPSALETTGRFASPLAAATAATAAPSTGAGRAAAPARNGAAAYAAARPAEQLPRTAEPAAPPLPHEDDAVSELAGLFADAPADPPVTLYGPASHTSARGTAGSRNTVLPRADADEPRPASGRIGLAAALDPAAFSPDAPSPFTAALARMAGGDRDVRDAVEVALDQPRVVRGRSTAGSWPSRPASSRLEDTAAPSVPTRQEEEPVGDQVVAPPSIDAPHFRELPNWAAEPAPVIGSPREEAIAEVLRSALAQGHSDEALAGILRKMLAGASPQTALADPAVESMFQAAPVPATPAAPEAAPTTMSLAMALAGAGSAVAPAEVTVAEPVLEIPAPDVPAEAEPSMFDATAEETAPEVAAEAAPVLMEDAADMQPVQLDTDVVMADAEPTGEAQGYEIAEYDASDYDVPAYEAVTYEQPAYEPPAHRVPSYRSPAYESPLFDSPLFSRPTTDNTSMWGPSVASIWGEPTSSHVPLWGEPAPFSSGSYQADLPIWDDVVSGVRSEQVEASESSEFEPEIAEVAEDVVPEPVEAPLPAEAEAPAEAEVAELAPIFARTASDPAPLSLDATSVMPPLSLLPPLPGSRSGRGRPPVPPAAPRSSSRSTGFSPASTDRTTPQEAAAPEVTAPVAPAEAAELPVETASMRAVEKRTPKSSGSALATVTRLPVAAQAEIQDLPEIDLFEELDAPAEPVAEASAEVPAEPVSQPLPAASGTVEALTALGLPNEVLGENFARDLDTIGTYAALTRALSLRLPAVPELPTGAGEVLFVVGPGVETLRAARTLAASLRLDPESVQWATRGDLAGLAPRDSRMTTVDAARQRRQSTADAGTVTIVAVDVPLRTDAHWMEQMLTIWSPVAVWAVVEATRKPSDLDPWLAGLTTVDALIVTDTDLSGEPAAALRRAGTPVAVVDGVRATAHRWASLLCERLETRRA